MELTRLAIVYAHLIACCAAIGLVLTSDIAMVKKLVTADPTATDDTEHLRYLKKVISISLIALWLTGIAIVSLDASVKGMGYFANPKLQAKIGIVILLTINGFLLHHSVMPAIEKFGSLLRLPLAPRMLAIFAGSVSGVSWFYAALLGVGRPLSWKYSLVELLAPYPLLIVGGIAMMVALTSAARSRGNWGLAFQEA